MRAEVVGVPSEADGIALAVGIGDHQLGVFKIEYPMRMIDPAMVRLAQQLRERDRA